MSVVILYFKYSVKSAVHRFWGLQYSIFSEMKERGGLARKEISDEDRVRLKILQWPGEQWVPWKILEAYLRVGTKYVE